MTVAFELTETVTVLLVYSISSHPVKENPSLGVANISISVPSEYSPPAVDTLPPSLLKTVSVYSGINSKTAFKDSFEFTVMVKLLSVELLPSHPTNSYPSSGLAVIVTSVPSS